MSSTVTSLTETKPNIVIINMINNVVYRPGTDRFVKFNCCDLAFAVRDSERFSRWMNLPVREKNQRHRYSAVLTVVKRLKLNRTRIRTYLINASNDANRLVNVLRQHRTIYSRLRNIQDSCHLDPLLFWREWTQNVVSSRGKGLV